jgi:hypothetical protein
MFSIEKEAILKEWEDNKNKACERGTAIHSIQEHKSYEDPHCFVKLFNLGGTFKCKEKYYELDYEKGVYPEYLISAKTQDGILRIAGQIDLMIKDGNDIIITDFKGLPLDTLIPTIDGFSTMGDLKVGDKVFDKEGNACNVINKSEVHNKKCVKITFDNNDSIVSDFDHRWLVHFLNNGKLKERVMTSEELLNYMQDLKRSSFTIPKILNPKPLNLPEKELPIDPYLLGVWLGDGSSACGMLTQHVESKVWAELENRGCKIGENCVRDPKRENVRMSTIFGLRTKLRKLNLLNNKHIPTIYLRSSIKQRIELLRGFMDTDGTFHKKRKRYVMATGQEWQRDAMVELLGSLGIKPTVFHVQRSCEGKKFNAWDVCFSTSEFNPFLTRNQDIDLEQLKTKGKTFRNIDKVEYVDSVPTQCIEVDSPSHTYLFGKECIVTHNTNKKLSDKSHFDPKTKSYAMMKYPLNHLMDCNLNHYALQLSLYAWLLQKQRPEFNIKKLMIIHFDHDGGEHHIEVPYLNKEVEAMLKHYKKELKLQEWKNKRKPINYE